MINEQEPERKHGFTVIPADEEFVARIASLIPMEHADKEALTTLIAGHRLMHAATSPAAQLERELSLNVRKLVAVNRVVHNLVFQLGGTATVKDDEIPFDWKLELNPVEAARSLTISALRCEGPQE